MRCRHCHRGIDIGALITERFTTIPPHKAPIWCDVTTGGTICGSRGATGPTTSRNHVPDLQDLKRLRAWLLSD